MIGTFSKKFMGEKNEIQIVLLALLKIINLDEYPAFHTGLLRSVLSALLK
jgi:hypothetical protein